MNKRPMTSRHRKEIREVFERALAEFGKYPNREEAQNLLRRKNLFETRIWASMEELSTFADEHAKAYERRHIPELDAKGHYPADYKLKTVFEQTVILREIFHGLGACAYEAAEGPIFNGAEGYFVIPRWDKIAASYTLAVERVLAELIKRRPFNEDTLTHLGSKFLRQHPRAAEAFAKLQASQKGRDLLVVQAQFGARRRGESTNRARYDLHSWEFGLGLFAVGVMLLTHPERIGKSRDELNLLCIGDEMKSWTDLKRGFVYTPRLTLGFSSQPKIHVSSSALEDHAIWYGPVSAFVKPDP